MSGNNCFVCKHSDGIEVYKHFLQVFADIINKIAYAVQNLLKEVPELFVSYQETSISLLKCPTSL